MAKQHPSSNDAVKIAKRENQKFIKRIEKRASQSYAVLAPCLNAYKNHIVRGVSPNDLLDNLTKWLLETKDDTQALIEEKMKEKWKDEPERVSRSVTNSLRRSAGTNYQALVSYALAQYLLATNSAWYLQHPVPKEISEALAITFTAGTLMQSEGLGNEKEMEEDGEEESDDIAQVRPDVDILLRNASWDEQPNKPEPMVLLSVKTSLVDRAGMAARWKTYFDLATNPCPHIDLEGCAYDRLGMKMQNVSKYSIYHGIVTANIYKYWFHEEKYKKGELNSGQTRSNTYMFELKFTTRNDGIAETPADWKQYPEIVDVLDQISEKETLKK